MRIFREHEETCPWLIRLSLVLIAALLASCANKADMVVSVRDQKMLVVKNGEPVAVYPVSTSKFGIGDDRGSYKTPLGRLEVAKKIGGGAPAGAVFKSRRRTGEVLPVDAPGRDPIVTRILWLKGKERRNASAYGRYIYIHGTPEERNIGTPASYGCIRMRSQDIISLYNTVGEGSEIYISKSSLPRAGKKFLAAQEAEAARLTPPDPPMQVPHGAGGSPVMVSNIHAKKPTNETWHVDEDEARRLLAAQNGR